MFRLFPIVAVLAFSSCASKPQVSGAFPLSEADIRAIQQLVDAREDIPKPVREIYSDHPNHAEVGTGTLSYRIGSGSLFTVAKRRGQWVIDSPVREEHIITH
jgi:hypothetical protein